MDNFAEIILNWYSKNKRELPWRNNPSPYQVLISEIMLQQTQVPRVIDKFKEFISLFPTTEDLAKASKAEVIKAWSGLGYNRRALLLHQFAQEVVEKYNGMIPSSPEELLKLPGIGPYTAGAISSFAYNQSDPAIDVNVRRIYRRYFHGKDQGLPSAKKEEQELYELARKSIPDNKSAQFHNALMDFGSLTCTRYTPNCGCCPLQKSCHFLPKYTLKKQKALFVMEKKEEKGILELGKFIPNRIFRGRIVEFARTSQGKEMAAQELGKVIKKDYTKEDEQWLLALCSKLECEGFISFCKNQDTIILALPNI